MLKRELTELGRTVQRRGDIVYHLQEILERDEKRVEDIDRNTIKKTKMLVEGGAAGARFLLESQARSKLKEERKIINQLQEEWAKKVAEDKEA